jgi:hypothetical protein
MRRTPRDHPIETPVRRTPPKIGTTTATNPTPDQRELRNVRHAKKAAPNWIQSDHQAVTKGQHDENDGQSSRTGRIACTAHVISLGVVRDEWPGSVMLAQLSGMPRRVAGARQVSGTEAVAA